MWTYLGPAHPSPIPPTLRHIRHLRHLRHRRIRRVALVALVAALAAVVGATLLDPASAGPRRDLPPEYAADPAPALVRHVHLSGLHGHKPGRPPVRPAQVRRDIDRLAPRADLLTTTEVNGVQRAAAMRPPGFGQCWIRGAETAVMFRLSRLSLVRCWVRQVAPRAHWFNDLTGRWAPMHTVTAALLRLRSTGATLLVSVAHTPPCVESPSGRTWMSPRIGCGRGHRASSRVARRRNASRPAAYRALTRGWAAWVGSLRSTYRPTATISTGDFNLDFKRAWVRRWLLRAHRPAGVTQITWRSWSRRTDTMADHNFGRARYRLVDATLVGGGSVARPARAFAERVSSDHAPFEDVIRVP